MKWRRLPKTNVPWKLSLCLPLITLFGLLLADTLFAFQENMEKENKFWVNLGFIGFSAADDLGGFGSVYGISFENQYGVLSIRYSYHQDDLKTWERFGTCFLTAALLGCEERNVLELEEWGVLYGRSLFNSRWVLSAGISEVTSRNTIDKGNNFSVIGIPLEANWRPYTGKYFGIGVIFLGNINKEKSFGGIFFTVRLGKFK